MSRILTKLLLTTALVSPLAVIPAIKAADQKVYHDKGHNDEHQWNDHEDKAYRMWVKESHRKYKDFAKLKEEDQQQYWAWRHDHSDAVLKIDIR